MLNITRLFALGRLAATCRALDALDAVHRSPLDLIRRHVTCDWSELDAGDRAANAHAVAYGERVLSAYTLAGRKFWVLTEADRSATLVLLPEDY